MAALGLLALVALASEEAPFDVKDDTGTVHGPSWVSIVLLAVIVMMIAFAVLLALSARTVADGTLRVRRRRSMIQMLVLAALAFLALSADPRVWHRQAEARPAGSDTRHPGREPSGGSRARSGSSMGCDSARWRRARRTGRGRHDEAASGRRTGGRPRRLT